MTDVIEVALKRRARLEAEIVRLNEFVAMARMLREWGEGRCLLPAVSLTGAGQRAVPARSPDVAAPPPHPAPARPVTGALLPAGAAARSGSDHSPANGVVARRRAFSARAHALAIRYDETSTSLARPEQVARLRDGVLAAFDGLRSHMFRRGRLAGLVIWVAEIAGRAFGARDAEAADPAGPAVPSAGETVVSMRARSTPSPRRIDALVGRRLRQRRWMTGLTRQELAERAGFQPGEIESYEVGADAVVASRLWEIAAALNVPVTYFFEGADGIPAEQDRTVAAAGPDDEAVELVRAYYAIPEDRRRRLWDLARMLRSAA